MKTILEALQTLHPESSKNTLRSWIQKGRVSVRGAVVSKTNATVFSEKDITLGPNVSFTEEDVKILFEDRHLVVIEKPAKLLSVATDAGESRTAHAILKRRKKSIVYPVHRLDRDTSGVMVFVYTEKAQDHLKKQFEAHSIERIYFGLIEGHLPSSQGTWESNLLDDEAYFVRSSPHGERAVTHYEVVVKRQKSCIVRFLLETGKKNQIRVHASEADCPIVGDKKYGARTNPYKRLCLHAHILSFQHPVTGKKLTFTSPLPTFAVRQYKNTR